jgi:hypothetical protein
VSRGFTKGHPDHPGLLVQGEGDGLKLLGLFGGKEGPHLGWDLHLVELHQRDAEVILNGLGDAPFREKAHVH